MNVPPNLPPPAPHGLRFERGLLHPEAVDTREIEALHDAYVRSAPGAALFSLSWGPLGAAAGAGVGVLAAGAVGALVGAGVGLCALPLAAYVAVRVISYRPE